MIALATVCGCGVQLLRWGPKRLQVGLLAMSFLSKLSLFEVAGGRLVVRA